MIASKTNNIMHLHNHYYWNKFYFTKENKLESFIVYVIFIKKNSIIVLITYNVLFILFFLFYHINIII